MYRGMDIDAIKGHLDVCLLITEDERRKGFMQICPKYHWSCCKKKKSYER